MSEQITEEIKQKILNKSFMDKETGRRIIQIGNCRLDFSIPYFLNGFTNKGIKLSVRNGDKEINEVGKIEDRGEYFALYTRGWNYIEHLNKLELKN